jgi:hypothetical protein
MAAAAAGETKETVEVMMEGILEFVVVEAVGVAHCPIAWRGEQAGDATRCIRPGSSLVTRAGLCRVLSARVLIQSRILTDMVYWAVADPLKDHEL